MDRRARRSQDHRHRRVSAQPELCPEWSAEVVEHGEGKVEVERYGSGRNGESAVALSVERSGKYQPVAWELLGDAVVGRPVPVGGDLPWWGCTARANVAANDCRQREQAQHERHHDETPDCIPPPNWCRLSLLLDREHGGRCHLR